MKKYLFIFFAGIFFSCSNNTANHTGPDSINAIEDRPLQDTTVSPFPDGYAPPNADVDTSERVKDSIQRSKQQ